MINKLSFNIPVDFSKNSVPVKAKILGRITDSYFSFGTTRAVLLRNDGNTINVQLSNFCITNTQRKCLNFIKVISWITVITPILMLIGKVIFRALNNFNILNQEINQDEVVNYAKIHINELPMEKKQELKNKAGQSGPYLEFSDELGRNWILTATGTDENIIYKITLKHGIDTFYPDRVEFHNFLLGLDQEEES